MTITDDLTRALARLGSTGKVEQPVPPSRVAVASSSQPAYGRRRHHHRIHQPGRLRRLLPGDGSPRGRIGPDRVREIATRYGQTPHSELIAELSELYGVSP